MTDWGGANTRPNIRGECKWLMGFGALSVVPQTYFDIIARIVPALILSGARFVGRLTEHMATDTETSDFFEELRCLFGRLE